MNMRPFVGDPVVQLYRVYCLSVGAFMIVSFVVAFATGWFHL